VVLVLRDVLLLASWVQVLQIWVQLLVRLQVALLQSSAPSSFHDPLGNCNQKTLVFEKQELSRTIYKNKHQITLLNFFQFCFHSYLRYVFQDSYACALSNC
jgi:hypothetical protein